MISFDHKKLRLYSISGKGWSQSDCADARVEYALPNDSISTVRKDTIVDVIEEREDFRNKANLLRWQLHNLFKLASLKSTTIDDIREALKDPK